MKIIILSVLLASVFTISMKRVKTRGFNYSFSDPSFYSYTPVSYTYTPSSYYYPSEMYSPSSYSYNAPYYSNAYQYSNPWSYNPDQSYGMGYRRNPEPQPQPQMQENSPQNHPRFGTTVELEDQLRVMKSEIWGTPEFSTEEIRNNQKAYDVKWLLAQLKISKALELEDMIANQKKAREEGSDRISISAQRKDDDDDDNRKAVTKRASAKRDTRDSSGDEDDDRKKVVPKRASAKDDAVPGGNGADNGSKREAVPKRASAKDDAVPGGNGADNGSKRKESSTQEGK